MDSATIAPPAPPASRLRPLSTGELLDQAIYIYRSQFGTLVAFVALFFVPITLLNSFFSLLPFASMAALDGGSDFAPAFGAATLGGYCANILLGVVSFLLYPIQIGGVALTVGATVLHGQRLTLGEILRALRGHLSALVGVALIGFFFSSILSATLLLPPVGMAVLTLFGAAFVVAAPVVLFERRQGLAALRRGWLLVRDSVWRVLAYLFLYVAISYILSLLFTALGFAVAGLLGSFVDSTIPLLLASGLSSVLLGVLLYPLLYVAVSLIYFDLRSRHEGLDVALAAATAAGEPFDLSQAPVTSEPVLSERTWRAVGILSGVYLLPFLLFCGCLALFVTLPAVSGIFQ